MPKMLALSLLIAVCIYGSSAITFVKTESFANIPPLQEQVFSVPDSIDVDDLFEYYDSEPPPPPEEAEYEGSYEDRFFLIEGED